MNINIKYFESGFGSINEGKSKKNHKKTRGLISKYRAKKQRLLKCICYRRVEYVDSGE